ncbi:hypothetical protein WJX73_001560 [Symbiochloris irregularis]|uniref:Uncharacterized protein n=1 Tax=Symbiochloris irregularis TaxID=706552 RepID=A0AAW1NU93_9CHLO
MKKGYCKVYYSILGIAYLEVLLWITCLLTSCATLSTTPEDVNYIARETGNLKNTCVLDNSDTLPGAVDLRGGNPEQELNRITWAEHRQHPVVSPTIFQRPHLGLSFLLLLTGVPAPYTGVKSLHK